METEKHVRISFDTAQLLKHNKYPEIECPSYLLVDFYQINNSHINPNNLGYKDLIGYYVPNKTINAPTQSIVQKWLREVHHIHIIVLPSYADKSLSNKKHYFEISIGDRTMQFGDKYSYFKTYEQALETGLQEALKLI